MTEPSNVLVRFVLSYILPPRASSTRPMTLRQAMFAAVVVVAIWWGSEAFLWVVAVR